MKRVFADNETDDITEITQVKDAMEEPLKKKQQVAASPRVTCSATTATVETKRKKLTAAPIVSGGPITREPSADDEPNLHDPLKRAELKGHRNGAGSTFAVQRHRHLKQLEVAMFSKQTFFLAFLALAGMATASPTTTTTAPAVCTTTLGPMPLHGICADICSDPPPLCTGKPSVICCCTPVVVEVPC
ncbi:hypothetical protein M422DRAFT_241341 [Sphaerobolus stellatus SS14]|nr:hypothetical protein M422DRAFT_241341 [Sphaerobolus stellatus SS14]